MPRGSQVIRQWKLLRAIERARRGLSAAEAAQVVGDDASRRTVYRDLAQLQDAGFPLVDDEGRWRLLQPTEGAWMVPIDPSQVFSLVVSEDLFSPLQGSALAEPLVDLRQRLVAMLTPAGRAWCEQLRRTAVASLFAVGDYRQSQEQIAIVEDACRKEQRLRMRYATPGKEPAWRTVDPYFDWYASGRLYLVAWCHTAREFRIFAVQRIEEVELLDQTFDPDPDFDPAEFTRKAFGVFRGAVHHVIIEFSDEVAHLIREVRYHHTQRVSDIEGGVRLEMVAAGLPEIASWVAGFGGAARVVEPPELVAAVRAIHVEGLAVCGGVSPDDTGGE